MDKTDYVLLLHDSSESGFTQRTIMIPVSEITTIIEESVPTKGRRKTRIYTKHNASFGVDESLEDVRKLFRIVFNGEADHED